MENETRLATTPPNANFLRRASDIKMMEELNQLRSQLEIAKKDLEKFEKTKMLANVAPSVVHDIRNSLGVISSTAQFVLSILKPEEKEKQAWELVERNIENIKTLLKSYLRLAREVENAKELCSLNEIVARVAHFVEIQAKKQGIKIEMNLSQSIPMISLDIPAVESSILNIAINALEAMEKNGIIKFITYFDARAENLILEIEDNGPGIPQELTEKIFNPFFTTKKTGTGMGLYSAKAAIENNEGKIICESKIGSGTKMLISFAQNQILSQRL